MSLNSSIKRSYPKPHPSIWIIEKDTVRIPLDSKPDSQPCPECKGAKYVRIGPDHAEECTHCHGTGKVPFET